MKENWTYKKLGEVASFINGYPFKPSDWKEKGRPIIRIQNLTNPNAVFNLFDGEIDAKYIIHKGDVLIPWSATLGVFEWSYDYDGLLNQHIFKVVFDKDDIDKSFFKYVVASRINEMKEKVHGITMQHITKGEFDKTVIPVPPIETQSRIVSELDLLQSIIDKQKAQLKELDNLAQAVFYDMFGDPVENDKGWEVKLLSDVSELINGRAYKQDELLNKGKYKILRVGNFFTNGEYYYSDLELEDEKYCDTGDLLFAWSASFGAFIWDGGKVIYHYHIWKVVYDKKVLDIQYYRFLLNAMTRFFMKDVHGIGMVHLTKAGMEQYVIPIPPLSLQQSFAAKIESIEKQKAAITQSIAETQRLFDYTMDKYFG